MQLHGCPINKHQLMEVLNAFLNGRRPNIASHSVCVECKQRGTICVMVAHGQPCLGPVTHAGCGAICPACDRGCYGCFGPQDTANTDSLGEAWLRAGKQPDALRRVFHTFNAAAEPFADAGNKYGQDDHS
jgi:coenzyme F420-reducing hydrogenase gamma subunit